MADTPTTRPSLLVRIRDATDALAWGEFVDLYAPLIYGFARSHGLQDADAADVTQEVFRAVAHAARGLEYDPRRGSFRGWLFTVVRSKLRTYVGRLRRPGQGSGDPDARKALNDYPAPEEALRWEQEYERQLFTWAADKVRGTFQESTWQAFWRTAVEGQRGKDVARALGMTVASVYLAKGRVMAKLKELIHQVQGE